MKYRKNKIIKLANDILRKLDINCNYESVTLPYENIEGKIFWYIEKGCLDNDRFSIDFTYQIWNGKKFI